MVIVSAACKCNKFYQLVMGGSMDTKSIENNEQMQEPIKEIVTTHACERWGHHEIGITTDSGEYISWDQGW